MTLERPPHQIIEHHLPLVERALVDVRAGGRPRLFGRRVATTEQALEAFLDRVASLGVPTELGRARVEALGW